MEAYIINGCEVKYDTFDLEAMSLFDKEEKRVQAEAMKIVSDGVTADNYIEAVRKQCENILGFFDALFGEGASAEIFGGHINVKDIFTSYKRFCADVTQVREGFATEFNPPKEKRTSVVRFHAT